MTVQSSAKQSLQMCHNNEQAVVCDSWPTLLQVFWTTTRTAMLNPALPSACASGQDRITF